MWSNIPYIHTDIVRSWSNKSNFRYFFLNVSIYWGFDYNHSIKINWYQFTRSVNAYQYARLAELRFESLSKTFCLNKSENLTSAKSTQQIRKETKYKNRGKKYQKLF
jgi:hypothetical protein